MLSTLLDVILIVSCSYLIVAYIFKGLYLLFTICKCVVGSSAGVPFISTICKMTSQVNIISWMILRKLLFALLFSLCLNNDAVTRSSWKELCFSGASSKWVSRLELKDCAVVGTLWVHDHTIHHDASNLSWVLFGPIYSFPTSMLDLLSLWLTGGTFKKILISQTASFHPPKGQVSSDRGWGLQQRFLNFNSPT